MSGSSKPVGAASEDSPLGNTLDDMIRAVAHAPPRTQPLDAHGSTRWGEGGRYVVERRLGRGGMGTVYLADDTLLGRQVAVKVLDREGPREDPARRSRLVREARVAAGLEHERIARVYDVAEHKGTTFVAMEYVRGVTLRAWMTETTTTAELARVLREIAEGLAVLHAYDAANLTHELYNSSQAGSRDQFGAGNKYITPTIADGQVFLGTTNSVAIFGLLQ